MEHVTLRTGNLIPHIGLGTYKLSGQTCYATVKTALINGYRHIDTASMYKNEQEIGAALQESYSELNLTRTDLFLTSKLWINDYNEVENSLRTSLEQLSISYLDLYLMHFPFSLSGAENYPEGDFSLSFIPTHKVYGELENMVDLGLIKDIGIANAPACMVLDCLAYSRIKPSVIQLEIHPYNTQIELVEFCQRNGIVVTGFGSLGGVGYRHVHDVVPLLEHPLLNELSVKYEKTPGEVLLNWSLNRNLVIIPRSTDSTRQILNLKSGGFALSPEDLQRISDLNRDLRFYGATFFKKIQFPLFS